MQIAPILRELGFVDTKEVNKKLSCLDLPLIDMALFPGETTQPLSSLHVTFYRKLKWLNFFHTDFSKLLYISLQNLWNEKLLWKSSTIVLIIIISVKSLLIPRMCYVSQLLFISFCCVQADTSYFQFSSSDCHNVSVADFKKILIQNHVIYYST